MAMWCGAEAEKRDHAAEHDHAVYMHELEALLRNLYGDE